MHNKKNPWLKYAVFAAAIVAAYFINVEVQTHLGKKALGETGLEHHSLDQALALAQSGNKRVLADMSAIWCPTCRSLDKNVFSDAAVKAKINEKYVFARIEYESEEGEAFMKAYDVRRFPTLLILSPTGEKLEQLEITSNPAEFIKSL